MTFLHVHLHLLRSRHRSARIPPTEPGAGGAAYLLIPLSTALMNMTVVMSTLT